MTTKERYGVPDNEDDFTVRGRAYEEAWEVLRDGCEVPPSWDVFTHEVEELRKVNPELVLSVQDVAERVVKRYRRIAL